MKYLIRFTKPSGVQVEPSTDVALHTVYASGPTEAVLQALKHMETSPEKDAWNSIHVEKA